MMKTWIFITLAGLIMHLSNPASTQPIIKVYGNEDPRAVKEQVAQYLAHLEARSLSDLE